MLRTIQRRFGTSVNLLTTPLQVFSYPGGRVLTLNQTTESNPLSKDIVDSILSRLDSYQNNEAVEVVLINSQSSNKFSKGVDPKTSKNYVADLNAVNELNKRISTYVKPTVVVYEGGVEDSGYTAFASSKFRLGTENTTFSVKGLKNGYLPLGGGLIHHLLNLKKDGAALAKFLPLTGWEVKADEMYGYGLLTHVVQTQPHHILFQSLSNTQTENYKSKAYQTAPIQVDSLKVYLDLMHIGCEELDDILEHPLWSKVLLVPPSTVDNESNSHHDLTPETVPSMDIAEFRSQMIQCFHVNSLEECKKRLEKSAANISHPQRLWAQHCLQEVNKVDPVLAKEWIEYVDSQRDSKIEQIISTELKLAKSYAK